MVDYALFGGEIRAFPLRKCVTKDLQSPVLDEAEDMNTPDGARGVSSEPPHG